MFRGAVSNSHRLKNKPTPPSRESGCMLWVHHEILFSSYKEQPLDTSSTPVLTIACRTHKAPQTTTARTLFGSVEGTDQRKYSNSNRDQSQGKGLVAEDAKNLLARMATSHVLPEGVYMFFTCNWVNIFRSHQVKYLEGLWGIPKLYPKLSYL